MNSDSFFQPYLIPGESLRWSASVRTTLFQQVRPFFLFLALFLVAFFFIFQGMLPSGNKSESVNSEITPDKSGPRSYVGAAIGGLVVGGFFTIWCWAVYTIGFKELAQDRVAYAQSHYGLTQYRLIWINGEKKRRVYTYLLSHMEHFRLDERENGTGDIFITLKPHGPHHPFQPPMYKSSQPVLRAIPNAAQVYQLIFQAKLEAKV